MDKHPCKSQAVIKRACGGRTGIVPFCVGACTHWRDFPALDRSSTTPKVEVRVNVMLVLQKHMLLIVPINIMMITANRFCCASPMFYSIERVTR